MFTQLHLANSTFFFLIIGYLVVFPGKSPLMNPLKTHLTTISPKQRMDSDSENDEV